MGILNLRLPSYGPVSLKMAPKNLRTHSLEYSVSITVNCCGLKIGVIPYGAFFFSASKPSEHSGKDSCCKNAVQFMHAFECFPECLTQDPTHTQQSQHP